MSLDTPRSCGGFTTPRIPNDILYDLDLLVECDAPELPSKPDSNRQSPNDAERDIVCGALGIYDQGELGMKGDLVNCQACEDELLHKIAVLEAKLSAEVQARSQQTVLMSEYEKKVHEWITEKNKEIEILRVEKRNLETECSNLKNQLETASRHLRTIEISFNDVHEKYERAKQNVQILTQNIEILKSSLTEHKQCIRQKHNQFLRLKEHAIERLDYANVQLDLIERKYSLESSKLRAAVGEAELNVRSLSQQLEHRNRENDELTSICNDLLKKLDAPVFAYRSAKITENNDQTKKDSTL